MEDPEDQCAHVEYAKKMFRDVGFTIEAMRYRRTAEALEGLRQFNNVPAGWRHPVAWEYFPNEHMRDNWQQYYGARP